TSSWLRRSTTRSIAPAWRPLRRIDNFRPRGGETLLAAILGLETVPRFFRAPAQIRADLAIPDHDVMGVVAAIQAHGVVAGAAERASLHLHVGVAYAGEPCGLAALRPRHRRRQHQQRGNGCQARNGA